MGVAVVDYRLGNVKSIMAALLKVGAKPVLSFSLPGFEIPLHFSH